MLERSDLAVIANANHLVMLADAWIRYVVPATRIMLCLLAMGVAVRHAGLEQTPFHTNLAIKQLFPLTLGGRTRTPCAARGEDDATVAAARPTSYNPNGYVSGAPTGSSEGSGVTGDERSNPGPACAKTTARRNERPVLDCSSGGGGCRVSVETSLSVGDCDGAAASVHHQH